MSQTYSQLRLDLASSLAEFLDPLEAGAETIRWFEEGLGRNRAWLAAHGNDPVPDEDRRRVSRWMRKRRTGEPWSYIIGWCPFRGHRFKVDKHVLIPRPETELVLEAALDVGRRLKVHHACDIGTGSGILAICMAMETDWKIRASDVSAEALTLARKNAIDLQAEVEFTHGNLLEAIPGPLGLVVSNPPYVDPADEAGLQRELAFEPRIALFAGDRGMELSTEILLQARKRFAPGVVLEIGDRQGREMKDRALSFGWKRVLVHQDLAGLDRVLVAIA